MSKLSDTQLVILSAACQRENRSCFPIAAKVSGGALQKVVASLMRQGLLQEIPAKPTDHVWRTDEDGSRFTLRATAAACEALGVNPPEEATGTIGVETAPRPSGKRSRKGLQAGTGSARPKKPAKKSAAATGGTHAGGPGSRAGTKQAELIAMLKRPEGASIDEIIAATGWQAHTVRGAIAGALKKKLGLAVASEKLEGRGRVYRLPS